MRGIATGGNDNRLWANITGAESASLDVVDVTATGFKITHDGSSFNATGTDGMIYIAIRRPDGYVGKLPSAGTGAFAMDAGAGSSTIPNFDSGFPVDFGLVKLLEPWNATENWYACNRVIAKSFVQPNDTGTQGALSSGTFDSNVGWANESSWGSNHQSWMWKRGQGMDVLAWTGNDVAGHTIRHSMNAVPEMMWVKNRSASNDWMVYHKGLNGGTNPEQYYAVLNSTAAEVDQALMWNDTAPTSSVITLGSHSHVNGNLDNFVAFLLASANDAD